MEKNKRYSVMHNDAEENFNELLRLFKIYEKLNTDSCFFLVDDKECDNRYSISYKFYPRVRSPVEMELYQVALGSMSFFRFLDGVEIRFVTTSEFRMLTSFKSQSGILSIGHYSPTMFEFQYIGGVLKKYFDFCIDDKGNKIVQKIDLEGFAK